MKNLRTMILYALFAAMLILSLSSASAEDNDTGFIKQWTFDEITNISEYTEFSNTNNSSKGISSVVEDGMLKYSKNGTNTHTMYFKFADYVPETDTYAVSYDLKAEFDKNRNFILRCGTNIQLVSQGDGTFVIQCFKNGKFVTENTAKYNLSEFKKIEFAVRNKKTVDVYIGSTAEDLSAVYEGLEFMVSSSVIEDSLGFTFNAGSNGSMFIDNIRLTRTVPEKKDITALEFKNCSGKITVDKGDILKTEITAEAASGIERIDVYADDEIYITLTEPPYIADLSNAGSGNVKITAEAVSNAGDTLKKSIEVEFRTSGGYTILSDSEFEEGEASALKSGIKLYPRRGYTRIEAVDDEHGNSLLVGIDNADLSYAETDIPYADIPINGYKGRMSFDCDVYISAKENSGKKTMVFRMSNDKETNIVRFKEPQMLVAGSVNADYDEGRWYHLTAKIDTVTCRMEIFIDHMPVIQYTFAQEASSGKLIRLYGPGDDSVKCFTAIDNIDIKGYYDVPHVLSVEDGNDVSPDKTEITEYLSGPLYEKSINTETVRLLDEDGNECPVSDAYYTSSKNSVTVVPGKLLMPDSEYKIVISPSAEILQDMPVGEEVSGVFRTLPQGIAAEKVQIVKSGSLCKADVRVKNMTEKAKTVYVVLTLWNDKKGIDMKISPLDIAPNTAVSAEIQTEIKNANAAEVYIYNNAEAEEYLCSRIYKKEF